VEAEKTNMILDALIAHATREGLGEEVNWPEVEATIFELLGSPTAVSKLQSSITER